MGSEVLSNKSSVFMLFVYLVTSMVTFILATGSLGLERQAYSLGCFLIWFIRSIFVDVRWVFGVLDMGHLRYIKSSGD